MSTTSRSSQPTKSTGSCEAAASRVSRSNPTGPGELPRPGRSVQRRRAVNPSAARALAMLTQQPIFAAPVPQIHVGPRGADGSILVDDRASNRRFLVYTPRRDSQFRAGYRSGLWYVRIPGDIQPSPRSQAFPTAVAAIDTLRLPRGLLPQAEGSRPHCRVLWS